jgi:predicted PurR-regulated permease PerM
MMTLGTAEQVALYIFLIFVAIFAITTVALLAGIVFGLTKLNEKLDSTIDSVRPLIAKSSDVLDTVQRVTVDVGERADAILSQGEDITANVSRKVDRASSVVEKAVTDPLINAASVLAGISRGLRSFNHKVHENRNGSDGSHVNGYTGPVEE